jgi:protein-S-isoprenylcysteine O-methyltransferase Ste14
MTNPPACHHGAVIPADRRAVPYTLFTVALWAGGLPVMVLIGETGDAIPVWRPFPFPALGAVALLAGTALVFYAGRHLAGAGVGLFGTTPGPVLVTDSLYGYLRHPMDAGIVLIASAPALALGLSQAWVVPLAALVYLVAGFEPFEERRLLEEFGEEYLEYKRAVPRWFPRDPG